MENSKIAWGHRLLGKAMALVHYDEDLDEFVLRGPEHAETAFMIELGAFLQQHPVPAGDQVPGGE